MSKFPPSVSGIGLYAETFTSVLGTLGPVGRLRAPSAPAESQRLRSALAGTVAALSIRRAGIELVHVELGGRGLFEFYFAVATLLGAPRPTVIITCHDVPAVAGPPFLFAVLDRKGLRRLGMTLSRRLGVPVERWLLRRADAVVTLTRAGADALSAFADRNVDAMPHVIDCPCRRFRKDPLVFVPGYVDDAAAIVEVARLVASEAGRQRWRLVVGACSQETEMLVRAQLAEPDIPHFLGYVDEEELLRMFDRAAVVVRIRRRAKEANYLAASGPLSWAVARGCVVITNDDRAGALELEAEDLLERTSNFGDSLPPLLALPWEELRRRSLRVASASQDFAGIPAAAGRYHKLAAAARASRITPDPP